MRNSKKRRTLVCIAALLTAVVCTSRAKAQQQAKGFGLERFYPSAPGGGWFVMDALDMRGGLGGVMAMTLSYARNPLRIGTSDGMQHLAVVSHQAFTDFGFAATFDRFRLYLNFDMPLSVKGNSGTVGAYSFTAPSVDLASNPDSVSDVRIGFDSRLFGNAYGPLRLGAGAQLFVPNLYNAARADYESDGTYRAMGRFLVAGDVGQFTYAGQVGAHIRPLNDSPTPGSPEGSELLFGAAAGAKLPGGDRRKMVLVVGPELYGATPFRSLFDTTRTALEGLLTGRLEGTADDGPQLRFKLGAGAGLNPHFGAPEWRLVFGMELFDHHTDRDKDGISDRADSCPDVPGERTTDPKSDGCPSWMNDEGRDKPVR